MTSVKEIRGNSTREALGKIIGSALQRVIKTTLGILFFFQRAKEVSQIIWTLSIIEQL